MRKKTNFEYQKERLKGPLGGNFLLFRELDFQKLKEKIQKVNGIKLNGYRDDFLQRRLIYHFTKNKINGIDEYIDELSFNQILIKDLMDCLSINLSYFFRDQESFLLLKEKILPELFQKFHEYDELVIWSLGCSVGAEILSVALTLNSMGLLDKAKLIALDNDSLILERAQKGLYFPQELKFLPNEYEHFFSPISDESSNQESMQIDPELVKRIQFIRHDLTLGLPRKGIMKEQSPHLIISRNVIIYFSRETKETLYETIWKNLLPSGVLFIGSNELISGPAKDKFKKIDNQFYLKPKEL
ncbi:MAG: CheR family methyltransferase [Candidatus Melainabacteria bacterium]|jgi:chemotaxis protein methyltransferase CheR